jgi:hypothetical protein
LADFVLAAHGPFSLAAADALVLQWFEEAGLDVGYVEETAMIAWIDEEHLIAPGLGDLEVEVRFDPLEGHWIQTRWSFLHSDGRWAVDLVRGEGLDE